MLVLCEHKDRFLCIYRIWLSSLHCLYCGVPLIFHFNSTIKLSVSLLCKCTVSFRFVPFRSVQWKRCDAIRYDMKRWIVKVANSIYCYLYLYQMTLFWNRDNNRCFSNWIVTGEKCTHAHTSVLTVLCEQLV